MDDSKSEQSAPPPSESAAAMIADLKASGARQRQALASLYRSYAPRLLAYYQSHGADRALADDWVQDTFIRVMRGVTALETDAAFAGWLWTIARNVMIDARRRKDRHFSSLDDTDEDGLSLSDTIASDNLGPDEELENLEHSDCVSRQFALFRRDFPDRAQCIVWACRDDMSMSDIAMALGRSVGATREYISQCRKKARSYLEPCLETAGA